MQIAWLSIEVAELDIDGKRAAVRQLATKPLPHQLIDIDLPPAMFDRDRPAVAVGQEGAEGVTVATIWVLVSSRGRDRDQNGE
ncbi:MAG: hypothetical protein DLM61_17725 [Pseudonocardiales bacterium]|nr:MAG: hypothetical protein DLM61_17725 [Pseudonocardiales bacterium]